MQIRFALEGAAATVGAGQSRALAALLGLRLRLRKEVGDKPSGKRRGWQQAVVRSLAALEAQRGCADGAVWGHRSEHGFCDFIASVRGHSAGHGVNDFVVGALLGQSLALSGKALQGTRTL